MKFATSGYIVSLATLIFTPASSFAQVATTTFNVQITIEASCLINSAGLLNFGTNGVLSANVDSTSQIVVQCTTSTPFTLGLSAGTGSSATVANRLMTGPAAATISYSLYRDSGHTQLWGNTVGTDRLAGTGTGAAQTFTIYGRVPPQTTPAVGVYTDTVTATLNY
ncbi:Csu type fimbrial protein [Agrobacterium sp. rho-13.3]|uniref:Csu type fimbrial protein n=1 Tax=Agrobacterium sp. rho-13.3 TaxID=3072980 RepID=UPI002A0D2D4E|nr:spore coat U domain-containing protein [Agrobacterium sp. rho-13.3]MDX8308362.1 spore coat U domain-containing protein [Agrobacterium sp. rho-13.3]